MQIHCYRTAKHRGNSTQSKPRAAGLKGGGQRPDPIHISHRVFGCFFFFSVFCAPWCSCREVWQGFAADQSWSPKCQHRPGFRHKENSGFRGQSSTVTQCESAARKPTVLQGVPRAGRCSQGREVTPAPGDDRLRPSTHIRAMIKRE